MRLRIFLAIFLSLIVASAQGQDNTIMYRVKKVSTTAITVTWKSAPGVDIYDIYYQVAGGDIFERAGTTSGNSFTISGLRPSTRYGIELNFNGERLVVWAYTADYLPPPVVKPLAVTCPSLPASVVVRGYGHNTQCKRVGEAGVGVAELIAQGIVDALDVHGSVYGNMQVCFRNQGILKFLDAATMPRTVSDLAAAFADGMTCGTIDRPGTVALLRAGESQAGGEADTTPAAAVRGAVGVNNCRLRTIDYVSLRAGPSVFYARRDVVPQGARLTATARSGDWYLVEYEAQPGWVSGDYVAASAGCDAVGEASFVFISPPVAPIATATQTPEPMAEAAPTETAEPRGTALFNCELNTGDIINLRTGPGLDFDVIAEIPFKTGLSALERAGDWFKVEYESLMGWVNIDYVFRSGYCG